MLIACPQCRHQYDAGELPAGSAFHCHCGSVVKIPEIRAREAVVAHCASCGAQLAAEAKSCQFCGSEVSAVDHHVGEICPECYRRLLRGAKFCSGCGVEIRAEKLHDDGAAAGNCPRCEVAMRRRPVRGGSFSECSRCGGIWLGEELFERIVEERGSQAVGAFIVQQTGAGTVDPATVDDVRYIPCPVCAQLMNRRNFARISGVVIDWCRGHGYWFDAFELQKILEFVRRGGLDQARERRLEKLRYENEKSRRAPPAAGLGSAANHPATGSAYGAFSGNDGTDIFDLIIDAARWLFRRH